MVIKRSDSVFASISGERYTPFALAKKLGALAILESASFTHGRDRYSIILAREAFRIRQGADGVFFTVDGEDIRFTGGDILDAEAAVASQNALPPDGIPLPGAGVGFLGYEFCQRCDKIALLAQDDSIEIPESEFIVGHVYLVFDHFTDVIHIFGLNYEQHEIDLEEAVAEIKRRLGDLDFSYLAPPDEPAPCAVVSDEKASHANFVAGVRAIKEHIVAGNLLQCVMSRRLTLDSPEPALEVYRRLRSKSPSPYLFYLDFGNYQIIGASPESLVRVRDSVASIRPIAGTRRRGKNTAEDMALEKELLADPKERAEHLMLVDLARNDLGRVCVPGSVRLTRNMTVEMFSHVMHIVSDVVAEAGSKTRGIDVLRAAFPAGTVSGAPKIRAIEILSSLEKERRTFYAGAVGYVEPDGDLDFCIAIRCALKQGNRWTLQAGAGIVNASDPEREWEETNEKLAAMRSVLDGRAAKAAEATYADVTTADAKTAEPALAGLKGEAQ
ncbi:MAG TPA: chorismate-binding protein [Treponemataceae bacterium]|nr:chorismate-binding protein [Treponemataceae bacterium]